jgi:putative membrane protein
MTGIGLYSALAATSHYLALGIGLGSIYSRGKHLKAGHLKLALSSDNAWGIATLLWIASGLLRAFGGLEKGSAYYLHNHFFWLKMTCFALIFVLELWPMIRLIQVRIRKEESLSVPLMQRFATISFVQVGLLLAMVLCASLMARGYGVMAVVSAT